MASAALPVGSPQKKTVQVVVFDVSGSMQTPLELRLNARDTNKGSGKLDPKRAQTVFDVICRLAEDGIAAAKDQDMEVAVLCFGLRDVSTCDLLALLDERTKILELLNFPGLSYDRAAELLVAHGINPTEVQILPKEVPNPSGKQLCTVVGYEPLVKLLASAHAPYCEKYIKKHMTPKWAGKYFMAFASLDCAEYLNKLVTSLPDECKQAGDRITEFFSSFKRNISDLTPERRGDAVRKATRDADDILAGKDKDAVLAMLKSIPTATPKPLKSVFQLVKRLQSALKQKGKKGRSDT